MNATLAPALQASGYSSAYLYNMMGKGGPSVYEWTKETGTGNELRSTDALECPWESFSTSDATPMIAAAEQKKEPPRLATEATPG
jgi:hypothetical protein